MSESRVFHITLPLIEAGEVNRKTIAITAITALKLREVVNALLVDSQGLDTATAADVTIMRTTSFHE